MVIMNSADIQRSIDSLTAVLAQIDARQIEATDMQRAYLAGSLESLRALSSQAG
jgi:hypothetical protein